MEEEKRQSSRRVAASDDLEVSTYLEIAKEKGGRLPEAEAAPMPFQEAVVIIDFGSQYSRLIARRVRELKVYCELVPHDTPWEQVAPLGPRGIILSGGPASVYEEGAPLAPSWVYDKGLPVLGICYGMQVITHQLGGRVEPGTRREYGSAVVNRSDLDSPLFANIPFSMQVWMSHGDRVAELPPGFKSLAYSENSATAIVGNGSGIFGLQFHPEVVHTPDGKTLIENFLYHI